MYPQILTSVKITEELILEGGLEGTVDLNSEYGSITVNKEKVKTFNIEPNYINCLKYPMQFQNSRLELCWLLEFQRP